METLMATLAHGAVVLLTSSGSNTILRGHSANQYGVQTMDRIARKRIVPAAVVKSADEALKLAEAMMSAELDIIEITFRTDAAVDAIRSVARAFPAMLVGAGTVLAPEQLRRAVDAGARFGVAPGLNEAVVQEAARLGAAFVPGVATPTEVDRALGLGCRLLKFFPAEALGGVAMLKALSGPFAHTGVKFVPTGGISAKNARDYLALPLVAALGGTWMVSAELIKEKNWAEITRLCREALTVAATV
jgi:2-dehydro-3-deoxyphosphogluconate aldolase/(4S)-4-hydroxy-2-oxoglutarate aldolase